MIKKPNEIKTDFKSIYHEIHERLISKANGTALMSHYGEFSQDLVNSLSEGLE